MKQEIFEDFTLIFKTSQDEIVIKSNKYEKFETCLMFIGKLKILI